MEVVASMTALTRLTLLHCFAPAPQVGLRLDDVSAYAHLPFLEISSCTAAPMRW